MLEIGRRLGARAFAVDKEAKNGVGPIEGAVFALLGLLVAFTFSGALSRFDERRGWIVDEANAAATAWLRIDLVPEDRRAPMRDCLRSYVDARLAGYARLHAESYPEAVFEDAERLGGELWRAATAAVQPPAMPAAATLLVPALNDVFDLASVRAAAVTRHPPTVVYTMLFTLALTAALFAGYGMGICQRRRWLHTIGFALVVSSTVGVTLDVEHPRQGLIRIDGFDQTLAQVRASMR